MQNIYVLTVEENVAGRSHYVFSSYENAVEYGIKILAETYFEEDVKDMAEWLREDGEVEDIMWISINAIDSCIEIY